MRSDMIVCEMQVERRLSPCYTRKPSYKTFDFTAKVHADDKVYIWAAGHYRQTIQVGDFTKIGEN